MNTRKTKTVKLRNTDEIRVGDFVKLRHEYSPESIQGPAVMTAEGKVHLLPYLGLCVLGFQVDGKDVVDIPGHEFTIEAWREIQLPELPTQLGTMVWTLQHVNQPPVKRILIRDKMNKFGTAPGHVWQGPFNILRTEEIGFWQPITPETVYEPYYDEWIEL